MAVSTTPPPPPPPVGGQSLFLGVPDDYVAMPPTPSDPGATPGSGAAWRYAETATGPSAVPPRYMSGDEFAPAALPSELIAGLQTQLAAAGLLTGTVKLGIWDDASTEAYRRVLSFANLRGLDESAALDTLASTETTDLSQQEDRDPYLPADPAEVRQATRTLFREYLGADREPTEDELTRVGELIASIDYDLYEATEDEAAALASGDVEGMSRVNPEARMQERMDEFFTSRYAGEIAGQEAFAERQDDDLGSVGQTVSGAI